MKEPKNFAELDNLTSKVLDSVHSEEDLDKLASLINSNPSNRKRYSRLILQESILHWENSCVVKSAKKQRTLGNLINFPLLSSIAAAIVIMLSVWLFHSKNIDLHDSLASGSLFENFDYSPADLSNFSAENSKRDIFQKIKEVSVPSLTSSRDYATKQANKGLKILETGASFADGALIEINDQIVSWVREDFLSVSAEGGVLPFSGESMMKFSRMFVDVESQTAEVSETLQVLDLRNINDIVNHETAKFDAMIHFNQGLFAFSQNPTTFSLSFRALKGGIGEDKETITTTENKMEGDLDPQTWERLESEFAIPQGTDFLVIALTASKSGPEVLLPDHVGYYADQFTLNLIVNGEKYIGPL